jgi:uncharacterized membrane protein
MFWFGVVVTGIGAAMQLYEAGRAVVDTRRGVPVEQRQATFERWGKRGVLVMGAGLLICMVALKIHLPQ